MSKLLVTAAGPRMRPALELARPTVERFATAHGYRLAVHHLHVDDEDDPIGRQRVRWRKVELLASAVEMADLVLWLDADALVVRTGRDIADDLPVSCFQGLVREQLPTRNNPNTGVWLLRGGPVSTRFLQDVADIGQLDHAWADQAAVCRALGWDLGDHHGIGAGPGQHSPYLDGTAWLAPEWNVVVPNARARIRHFAGMPMPERLAAMRAELHRVEAVSPHRAHQENAGSTRSA